MNASRATSALLVTVLLLAPHAAAQPADPARAPLDAAAIDRYVADLREKTRLPGLALAIVRGNETLHLEGYGEAGPGGRPVTPETPFLVASVTKTYAGLAIMQLAEAGKLSLDDPVVLHIPWFRVADEDATRRITIAHLLSHSSGLPPFTHGSFERVLGKPTPDVHEREVRHLAEVELLFPPGEGFVYSNVGFATLGLLVERVSGMSFEQYIESHVFAPLGMEHAHATRADAEADGVATGHRYRFGYPVPYSWSYTRAHTGGGFTYASAGDLAMYAAALLNGGELEGRRVLSAAGVAALHATRVTSPDDATRGYALGWFTGEMDGRRIVYHGGAAPDFLAQVLLVPEAKLGVVVLMNANDMLHSRFPNVALSVARMALGGEPEPATSAAGIHLTAYRAILVVDALLAAALVLPPLVRRARGKRAAAARAGVLALALVGGLWAALLLYALPATGVFDRAYLRFMAPDLALAMDAGGGLGILALVVGGRAFYRRTRARRAARRAA
ncbi:MAG TPA: serine hydrolase domain-containing protein [Candidatus Thermoplasmatota archaeon]|nr:serine hydrolase domain-containing protein [Candidatus Thermoplasmatota archaeon]